MGGGRRGPAHAVNVIAFSTARVSDWRWRIVNLKGETVEESSARFRTIAEAIAAGSEHLQFRIDGERASPP